MGEWCIPRPLGEMPLRAMRRICAGGHWYCIIREWRSTGDEKYPAGVFLSAIFGSGTSRSTRCDSIPPRDHPEVLDGAAWSVDLDNIACSLDVLSVYQSLDGFPHHLVMKTWYSFNIVLHPFPLFSSYTSNLSFTDPIPSSLTCATSFERVA